MTDLRRDVGEAPEREMSAGGSWQACPDGTWWWWTGARYSSVARRGADGAWTYERLKAWHNVWAGASLAVGVIDVFFLLGVAGIVLGPLGLWFATLGLRRAEDAPPSLAGEGTGRRMAIAGNVLAVVGIVLSVAWLLITSRPGFEF